MKKPDWLDHVNTYNLKLKLAFAFISISGVHALKTYLSGDLRVESIQIVTMVDVAHFTFAIRPTRQAFPRQRSPCRDRVELSRSFENRAIRLTPPAESARRLDRMRIVVTQDAGAVLVVQGQALPDAIRRNRGRRNLSHLGLDPSRP